MKVAIAVAVLVAISRGPGQDAPPPANVRPQGPVAPDSCGQCHANVTEHDALHGPVAVNACSACHRVESVEEHTYTLVREGADLCKMCHDVDFGDAAVVHEPLRSGDCLSCHDPHGGTTRDLLKAPSVDGLCKTCHEDVVGGNSHVHGPVASGACSVCHLPHASPHPGLLPVPAKELCTSCHVDTKTQIESARVVHGPAAVDCAACHDAHATNHPMMLKDEPQQLCLSCHEAIRHTMDTSLTQHAAVTTDRQCLNCHEAHASDHPRVLRDNMKTLCFECHDREIEMPDGKVLSDIKSVIEGSTSLHGPVAQDNCAACHMIHGGTNFRLLVQEYPPEFYAPFAEESYALCFSCHDRQLVYDERTTSLTDFRNGDLNLHYLHVNRDKKGRTCRACHETHASKNAHHVRESVPFGTGGWELPIGYKQTDTGGSCAPGCHKPYAYDRVVPAAYPAEPDPATWPTDKPGG
jgi:predicted CXXCH cytochrome family protein